MATPLENYQTAYQNISDQIATYSALVATAGNDNDSYSIDGQSFTRMNIFKKLESLYARQEQLKRLMQIEGGHYEVRSYGVVW